MSVSFTAEFRSTFAAGGDQGDTITTGAERDIVMGQAGDDSLTTGSEEDWLYGGTGADFMDGGQGKYHYYVEGVDQISDQDGLGEIFYGLVGTSGSPVQSRHGGVRFVPADPLDQDAVLGVQQAIRAKPSGWPALGLGPFQIAAQGSVRAAIGEVPARGIYQQALLARDLQQHIVARDVVYVAEEDLPQRPGRARLRAGGHGGVRFQQAHRAQQL